MNVPIGGTRVKVDPARASQGRRQGGDVQAPYAAVEIGRRLARALLS